jgi:hypothetical protein
MEALLPFGFTLTTQQRNISMSLPMRIRSIHGDWKDATVASLLHCLMKLFSLVKWRVVALLHCFLGTKERGDKKRPLPATTGTGTPRHGREGRSLRLLAWSRARDGSAPEL